MNEARINKKQKCMKENKKENGQRKKRDKKENRKVPSAHQQAILAY